MPQYGLQLSVFFIFNFFTYYEENAAVIPAFNDKITAQKYHKYRFCQAAAINLQQQSKQQVKPY